MKEIEAKLLQLILLGLIITHAGGGVMHFYLGTGVENIRLDNNFRYLVGWYFGMTFITAWVAWTLPRQSTLIYLLALSLLLAGIGRLISYLTLGTDTRNSAHMAIELVLPWIMIILNYLRLKKTRI